MCSISAPTSNASYSRLSIPKPSSYYILPFPPPHQHQKSKLVVFASAGNSELLKLHKFFGKNPQLSLPKIKDIKSNPKHEERKITKEPLAEAPNVILWKSTTFVDDDDDRTIMSSSLSLKPNLSLQGGKEEDKKRFSHMILVKNDEVEPAVNVRKSTFQTEKVDGDHKHSRDIVTSPGMGKVAASNLDQSHETKDIAAEPDSVSELTPDQATLQRPPKRLDHPLKGVFDSEGRNSKITKNLIPYFVTTENLPPGMLLKDREDADWKRAQDMITTTGRGQVELISCTPRGFVVSFGSLIGFLAYRNLATKWKFLAFESWLKTKSLDPTIYRESLGITGNLETTSVDRAEIEGEISPHMKLEDLLAIYDLEKLEHFSTFVGQKIKVNVIFVDRESRKLIFSVKPKEQEESIQRKRHLMAKLKVGHIVSCCIKKISYYGIFVEIEEVPALIHQTEVSWDATLNPTSVFKIGQVVEAKVHQLDFSLERIYLSLKEIMSDPVTESLESVLGRNTVLDSTFDTGQPGNEWVDLELLVEGLRGCDCIELVTKGRFFLSPGLTPAFRVYMVSMFKNQYKLLARAGNKVQEVVVQTWVDTEEMKKLILLCSNRIE